MSYMASFVCLPPSVIEADARRHVAAVRHRLLVADAVVDHERRVSSGDGYPEALDASALRERYQ